MGNPEMIWWPANTALEYRWWVLMSATPASGIQYPVFFSACCVHRTMGITTSINSYESAKKMHIANLFWLFYSRKDAPRITCFFFFHLCCYFFWMMLLSTNLPPESASDWDDPAPWQPCMSPGGSSWKCSCTLHFQVCHGIPTALVCSNCAHGLHEHLWLREDVPFTALQGFFLGKWLVVNDDQNCTKAGIYMFLLYMFLLHLKTVRRLRGSISCTPKLYVCTCMHITYIYSICFTAVYILYQFIYRVCMCISKKAPVLTYLDRTCFLLSFVYRQAIDLSGTWVPGPGITSKKYQ